jgi:hypothetical protein
MASLTLTDTTVLGRVLGLESPPRALAAHLWVDRSDDSIEEFDKLVRALCGRPAVEKPPLGRSESIGE